MDIEEEHKVNQNIFIKLSLVQLCMILRRRGSTVEFFIRFSKKICSTQQEARSKVKYILPGLFKNDFL